jgi:hypothetical protein
VEAPCNHKKSPFLLYECPKQITDHSKLDFKEAKKESGLTTQA